VTLDNVKELGPKGASEVWVPVASDGLLENIKPHDLVKNTWQSNVVLPSMNLS
jgi:hypothetical protein